LIRSLCRLPGYSGDFHADSALASAWWYRDIRRILPTLARSCIDFRFGGDLARVDDVLFHFGSPCFGKPLHVFCEVVCPLGWRSTVERCRLDVAAEFRTRYAPPSLIGGSWSGAHLPYNALTCCVVCACVWRLATACSRKGSPGSVSRNDGSLRTLAGSLELQFQPQSSFTPDLDAVPIFWNVNMIVEEESRAARKDSVNFNAWGPDFTQNFALPRRDQFLEHDIRNPNPRCSTMQKAP